MLDRLRLRISRRKDTLSKSCSGIAHSMIEDEIAGTPPTITINPIHRSSKLKSFVKLSRLLKIPITCILVSVQKTIHRTHLPHLSH